jgi:putative ABC transport system permease protein
MPEPVGSDEHRLVIRVVFAGLRTRPGRAAATGLAVVVGVAVVSGTLIISDTADRLGPGDDAMDLVRLVMLMAGGVAVLVGAFIVNVTLSVTVAQRTRELALLRCVGASRRQIRRAVRLEAAVIGLAGAGAGLALGFAVAATLRALINTVRFPGDLPGSSYVLTARTVAVALALGMAVTTLSAISPARRAGRLAPMAALRDRPGSAGGPRRIRTAAGAAVMVGAAAFVGAGVAAHAGPLLLPGAALTLVGVRLLGAVVAPRLAAAVGRPLARATGVTGDLARHNAVRNPDRTAATTSALMIGVALLGLVTVLSGSTRRGMVAEYDRYLADVEVFSESGLGAGAVDRLGALPEVAAVVPQWCTDGAVAGQMVCAMDPAGLPRVLALREVDGRVADLAAGGLVVEDGQARAQRWTVGSRVTVRLPKGERDLAVAAIYDGYYLTGGVALMVPADYRALGGDPVPRTAYLRAAPGVGPAAVRDAVAAVLGPTVDTVDRAAVRQRSLDQIDTATWVYRALTGLAALVGLFGVVNVLSLSIVERRRELGLLRAIGMQRRQIRSMVRAEAMITAVVGVLLGLGLGLLFGWAAARVLARSATPVVFTVPVAPLAAIALLVAVAGGLAGTLPARWAARTDIVRAVGTE